MGDNTDFDKEALDFLESYINTPSPTGHETDGQQVWMDRIRPHVDRIITDDYGSAAGVIGPDKEEKVVLEAHADEIGWRIHYISEDGFIYVQRNGGSDHQIAPSKRVEIHTENGPVKAVFGWPAIHTRDRQSETAPKATNIFLDCGCESREEVEELGVHVGCVVTYEDPFTTLNDRFFVGRALDNRIGGFMIAETAKRIRESGKDLPFGLYFVNAVQEEVGFRGASMITERIRPDVAIVTDVSHDTKTPMVDPKKEGDFKAGDGPVLAYGPAIQNKLREHIAATAKAHDIPFQRRAVGRSTGTDTDAFAYSVGGVPSTLLSLAIRYMHTTVEMAHQKDVAQVIELLSASLLEFKGKSTLDYFN